MSILNSASLVVTPNGYKASKLYSVIPADGSGDMTFTRAGDTATRVNSSGLIESVTANKPRLDYLGSTCPKLLLEPQRTNLALRSNEFDNASWTKLEMTITANTVISPDGTQNADKLVESANAGQHALHQLVSSTSGVAYTYSAFFKADGSGRNARLCIFDSSFTNGGSITFVSSNGTTTNQFNSGTGVVNGSTIQDFGNGWFRVSITVTIAATSIRGVVFLSNGTSNSYTGNGTSGIYMYGAQLEAGAYPTSYIPTTSATVTRNADSCGKTGISALLNDSQGTIYFNGRALFNTLASRQILELSDGSDNNKISIAYSSLSNNVRFNVTHTGQSTVTYNYQISNITDFIKMVVKYDSTNVKLFINGALVATTANSANGVVGLNQANMKTWWGGQSMEGELKSLAYWKTALSDADCITLTTL